MNEHLKFMERCHQLASEASEAGNTPVGSVIVREGVLIEEGREATRPAHDVTRHAEVEAIRNDRIAWVGFAIRVPTVGGFSSNWPILTATDVPIWGPPPIVTLLT